MQRWLLPARPAGLYDRQLVVLALALMAVGLVIVASASIPEDRHQQRSFMFVKRHGLFLLMALGISWFVLQVPMARWQHYNGPMLLLAIVMLVLVLLVGRSVNGSGALVAAGSVQPAAGRVRRWRCLSIWRAIWCAARARYASVSSVS